MSGHVKNKRSLAELWPTLRLDTAGLSLAALLTAAGWFLVVSPQLAAVTTRASLEGQLYTELAQAADLRAAAQEATRAATEAETQRDASAIQLLPATHLNARLAALTALATEHSLRVDAIAPGNLVTRAHRAEIPIRIEGRGAFPAITAFLAAMHRIHRDTAVRSMVLTADPNSATPVYKLEFIWAVAHTDHKP